MHVTDGVHNLWIIKPSTSSRGRGIRVVTTIAELLEAITPATESKPFVVQKYIENPLLLPGLKKFDIRVWAVVTSVEPLKIHVYNFPYIRICSVEYDVGNTDRMVHLTNNSVQRKALGEASGSGLTASDLMWSCDQFRDYLKHLSPSGGEWTEDPWKLKVYPQIKTLIRISIESIKARLIRHGQGFEWYGFDFMCSNSLDAVLIEANLDPDMSHSTPITAEIVPEAVQGLLDIVIDGEDKKVCDETYLDPLHENIGRRWEEIV